MEFAGQTTFSAPTLRAVCAGVLIVGLCLLGVGCSAVGIGGLDAPSGLTGESGDSVIKLSWDASEGAETYRVYRDTTSIREKEEPLAEGVSSASYEDTEVENGTTYYYRVTAVGAEGKESKLSDEIKATPFPTPPDSP